MRTIIVTAPVEAAELAADRLWVAGAQAVEERAAMGGRVELRTSLAADDRVSLDRLGSVPDDWSVNFEDQDHVPDQTWRKFAEPIDVNDRLVIQPAWLDEPERPGVLTVHIEPGGAFGLGDHPTTKLSAAAVDDLVRPDDRVLDVGCGSGVLAIVAARRGATRVLAVDIAEAAREATLDNAERNGVGSVVETSTSPVEEVSETFDLVLANILAPELIGMAPALRRLTAPRGRLVISGVLAGGYDHVAAALAPLRIVSERELDGWSAVTFAREQR